MGFGYASANIQRERNLAGGIAPDEPLTIITPTEIAGSSVTIGWDQGNQVADNFEVTIGTSAGGNSIARSGALAGGGKSIHYHTFDDLSYTTTEAWITVKYRLGDTNDFKAISRKVPVTIEPVESDPFGFNWNDSLLWSDDLVWTEG